MTAPFDQARLTKALDASFGGNSNLDLTLAVAVSHHGEFVAERYAPTASVDEQLISWSMGKSVTQALVGLLVLDGRIDIDAPAAVAEWADDDRANITLAHLLTMTSGLEFCEDYVDDQVSHVIEMLFGAGADDVAAYARSFPLAHAPGTVFNYSSGTTNIISAICGDLIAGPDADAPERAAAVTDYLQRRLFVPLGMASADPRFDAAGNFVGSSYLYATARDFVRFGSLYLRDGVCDGKRLLPEGWVDLARKPVELPIEEPFGYGAQWWLWDDLNAFGAHGYEGQYTIVVPDRDLVMVRLGKTDIAYRDDMIAWIREVVACFPAS